MLKKYTYLFLLISVLLTISSCHEDVGDINPSTETKNIKTIPLEFGEIEGELVGYVYNQENEPVANAEVNIYSSATTTNEFGFFNFQNVKLDPQGTFINVEKSGYLIGSDLVYPNSNGKGTSRIKMMKLTNNPSFQSSVGGTIEIEGGGSLVIQPNSLIRPNGSTYDGQVLSTAYRLSVDDSDFGNQMSGGLLGLDEDGRHRVLTTVGIVAIELRSFDNQILRLKSDATAELNMPIEPSIQNLLDGDVYSWSFDFTDGLWNEHESLVLGNQNLSTEIHSLGFWNFAVDESPAQVCGRLIYPNQLPAKNYAIQIINNGLPSRIGITDQDGYFCGKVPKGQSLKFQVLHPVCGNILHEMTIGEFDEVGTIGDVMIEADEKYLSGSVYCSGEGYTNATLVSITDGKTNFFYPNGNGGFSINLAEIVCGPSSSFTFFAFDNSNGMESELLTLDNNISEGITLEVCQSECLAEIFYKYEKDDYCSDGAYNNLIVEIENGSGDYVYSWENGSSDNSISNPPTGQDFCVTVTDVATNCEYKKCEYIPFYRRLDVESMYSSNTECQKKSGFIVTNIMGGKGPFEYQWVGPEGFISNDLEIESLSPGLYELTVFDNAGCSISESVEVYDVTTPINLQKEDLCAISIIRVVDIAGYKPYTLNWSAGELIGDELYVSAPGEYSLTLTDANLCTRSTAITIFNVGSLPEIDPSYECEVDIVAFENLPMGFDYFYQIYGSSEKIPVFPEDGRIEIEVLESGYRFELGTENTDFGDCSKSVEIELPRFQGLVIGNGEPASCETCADGKINYEIVGEDCLNCEVGETRLIRASNGQDVTALNELSQLENDEYYVVVVDANSGCYIAHSLVILE